MGHTLRAAERGCVPQPPFGVITARVAAKIPAEHPSALDNSHDSASMIYVGHFDLGFLRCSLR